MNAREYNASMKVLDEILPNNLWYIVGYIVADGNLSGDGRHISIVSKDIEHLIKIQSALQIDCKIGTFARGGSWDKKYGRLQFSNVNFYRWLQSINIGPNKSLIQGPINFDPEYIGDFIRGVIDGDGCIRTWKHSSNNGVQWYTSITSASLEFTIWIKELIEKHYKIKGRVHSNTASRKNTIYRVKFGKLASQVLFSKIYNSDCLCLVRKRKLAHLCLLDTKKMVNYNSVICSGAVTGSQDRLKIDCSKGRVGSIPTPSTK